MAITQRDPHFYSYHCRAKSRGRDIEEWVGGGGALTTITLRLPKRDFRLFDLQAGDDVRPGFNAKSVLAKR